MRASDVRFIEVESRLKLPAQLQVGAVYFVMDEGLLIVNHGGGRIVEYGKVKDEEGLPDTGFWPVSKGGTGSTTAEGARANLGVLGKTETAASAAQLTPGADIELIGAVTGKAHFTGTSNVSIVTVADHDDLETISNKAIVIANAAFASDTLYPSEKAVRTELDKKLDKNEAINSFRGIFPDEAALKTAIPAGEPGDYATVKTTGSTWIWNNATAQWEDSAELIADGIKSVNGQMGAAVILDIEAHLDGYKATTIEDRLDTKQDKNLPQIQAGLDANVMKVTAENPFATMSDITDQSLPDEILGLPPRVIVLEQNMEGVLSRQDAVKVVTSSFPLSKILNGTTEVPFIQLDMPPPYATGRTLVKDIYGTLGTVTVVQESYVVVTTVTTSFIGSSIPILLGNITVRGLLPLKQSDSVTVFNREASVGDRCRIITDDQFGGATTEIYVLAVGTETDPVLTWGNELILNTSDYQLAAPASLAGFVPTMGAVPGTWGPGFDPNRIKTYGGTQLSVYLPGKFCTSLTNNALRDIANDACFIRNINEGSSSGVGYWRITPRALLVWCKTPGTGKLGFKRISKTGGEQAFGTQVTLDPTKELIEIRTPDLFAAELRQGDRFEVVVLTAGTAADCRVVVEGVLRGQDDPER
jgi:hypothetical protein